MFPTLCLLTPTTDAYRADKAKRGLCRTWRCARSRRRRGADCEVCHCRLHRYRHPCHYAFVAVKASARKRGIGFELTFAQFTAWCAETGYVEKKGRDPESMTIDRIRSWEPYRVGNIRPLSHTLNVSKAYVPENYSEAENPLK